MWYTDSMGQVNADVMTEMQFVEPHSDPCEECDRLTKMTPPIRESNDDWPPKPGDTIWLEDDEPVTVVEFDDGKNWTGYASITYKYDDGTMGGCTSEWFQTKSQREETAELNREDD